MLSIGRVARSCGLSIGALRHYAEIGLFRPAQIGLFRPAQIDNDRATGWATSRRTGCRP